MEIKLDANQMKAVKHFKGPALVVAGPGSGKTTVIKERILNLIQEHNVDPWKILALAFNTKAVNEMEKRILLELGSKSEFPEIRTLHAFGLRIINAHYDRLKRGNKPEVWSSDPERTIKQEIRQLKRIISRAPVTIYKIESALTGKCYIGQTTNPERRRDEHFSFDDSSNSDLRQAMLNEGKEHFKFYPIDEVEGEFANRREAECIQYYRNRAVVNLLEPEVEQLETDETETYISIYKIENKETGICYIVQSTDSERNKVEDFTDSSNDEIRNTIENEGAEQFIFEALHKEVLRAEASALVKYAIKNASRRSCAVFNRNDPLKQRYSDQLMIELFCEHFNICYEEFLKHPSEVENLTEKIEDFEKIVDKVQKAKRKIITNFSSTNSIDDIVHSIIESIDEHVVRAFAEKYEKKKKKANAIDFQDMILYAVYLLEVYPDICARYREKYDYVLVDEFQDISSIDFRLIKSLSENLFVVGDDDQAIYGFRGGNSEIMLDFHKREDVKKYKITRNYRSTSTIVEHSKTLIEHNRSHRISKNLSARNPMRLPIKVIETTPETVRKVLLKEFKEPVCQTQFIQDRIPTLKNILLPKLESKTAILARTNAEVDKIKEMIERLLLIRFKEKTEVSTIHKAKGLEYEKVILIVNALDVWETGTSYKSFPGDRNNETEKQRVFDEVEERRVFYVAMTRAKQELVVLGGNCPFVDEFQNVPRRSIETVEAELAVIELKKQLEKVSRALRSAIVKRIDIAKKQVDRIAETMQITLTSTLMKKVETATKAARKQHKYELDRLRSDITETKNTVKDAAIQLETQLPTDLKVANEALLEGLIPVLDEFESQIKSLSVTFETNNRPVDIAEPTKSFQLAHKQLLDSLKTHGLKPIKTVGEIFDPASHEEILPAIYSDEVQADCVAREERRGYLLRDQVIRKSQVVVSKGVNIQVPEQLDRIVEIYLDRLISAFQTNFQLLKFGQFYELR